MVPTQHSPQENLRQRRQRGRQNKTQRYNSMKEETVTLDMLAAQQAEEIVTLKQEIQELKMRIIVLKLLLHHHHPTEGPPVHSTSMQGQGPQEEQEEVNTESQTYTERKPLSQRTSTLEGGLMSQTLTTTLGAIAATIALLLVLSAAKRLSKW